MVTISEQTTGTNLLVIHVAWSPKTGVLALIRNLANWQNAQPETAVRLALFDCDPSHLAFMQNVLVADQLPGKIFACIKTPFQRLVALLDHRLQRYIDEQAKALSARQIVIHLHNSHFSAVFLPLHAPANARLSCVVTFHGCPTGLLQTHPLKSLVHRFLRRRLWCSGVHPVSVNAAEVPLLAEKLQFPRESFAIVHNGVPIPPEMVTQRFPARQSMRVGFVSTFDENKRWWLAAEGVALARKIGADCQIVLAGRLNNSKNARHWAEKHSHFAAFLGEVPDAARTLIPELDVLILPSEREGIPMVILEALAAGVPVIATAVGGIPELIVSGVNGFLVDPSAEAIGNRISELWRQPVILREMRSAARQSAEQRFSIASCSRRYLEEYRSALANDIA